MPVPAGFEGASPFPEGAKPAILGASVRFAGHAANPSDRPDSDPSINRGDDAMSPDGLSAAEAGQGPGVTDGAFAYDQAFSRHLGLINRDEQARLRGSRVAILGMGGVGGIHLMTLTRLGIGSFHIADPDRFELANFNRQLGASLPTLGRNKAEVMAEQARAINPELDLRVFPEKVTRQTVAEVLDGVDVLVDGIDFFAMDARRLIFAEARRRGIWAVTAGPLGFSAAWLTFAPTGMSFDEYFDLDATPDRLDQTISFLMGLAPGATQRTYVDYAQADPKTGRGPSAALACHLCSGVAAAEVLKILLKRPNLRTVPHYFQFDAYRQMLVKGYLRGGNGSAWRRFKRRRVRKRLEQLGWTGPPAGI
jgi:molybdopterin/thiamine biosynthesis adenylyltransferase